MFVLLSAIYYMVKFSVYDHINKDIGIEVERHLSEISVENDKIILIDQKEWEEREHNSVDVNPVFIQFINLKGETLEKSPNLKNKSLIYIKQITDNEIFDNKVQNNIVRQIQVPIFHNDKKIGYLMIAMSLEDSILVLDNLQKIIVIAYPLVLLILFFIARIIAGRSIKPLNLIIETSNKINKDALSDRIKLPENKDELYVLSKTINNLLDRLENTIEREKQFTSDASHELRTPLAVIKGTLEVLIRKPRDMQEYQDKISFCILEVDRINNLVDQLLLLTRFENQKKSLNIQTIVLNTIVNDVLSRFNAEIIANHITVLQNYNEIFTVNSDVHLLTIIINNLISNAIKYSLFSGKVEINMYKINNQTFVEIKDNGIGIEKDEIAKIFDSFYRTSTSIQHTNIKGIGLGLSIVKRLCHILAINIKVQTNINVGTTFILSLS